MAGGIGRRLRVVEQVVSGDAVLDAVLRIRSRPGRLGEDALGSVGRARVVRRGRVGRAAPPATVGVGVRVVVRDGALLGVHIPSGLARRASLGGNRDHAVGGISAVQGRRRRTLHDIDGGDLVGGEIVDAAGRRTPDVAYRRGAVLADDPDTVDDVDRLVIERQAVGSADPHPRRRPSLRARQDIHAGGVGGEQIGKRLDCAFLDLCRRVDPCDRVPDFFPRLVARRRDDYLVQRVG